MMERHAYEQHEQEQLCVFENQQHLHFMKKKQPEEPNTNYSHKTRIKLIVCSNRYCN